MTNQAFDPISASSTVFIKPAQAVRATAQSYIREMRFGEIVTGTFRLCFGNLGWLLPIVVVPTLLASLVLRGIQASEPGLIVSSICEIIRFVVIMVLVAAMTIAVSDICLGKRPNTLATYRRLADRLGGYISTYLLTALVITLGLVLLIVPGLIAALLFAFVPTVTVLEHRRGLDALRRSATLGKGAYLRNYGILLGLMIIVGVAFAALTIAAVFPLVLFAPGLGGPFLIKVTSDLAGIVINLPVATGIVLLYYDMRVRKENYDAAALAADLTR